MLNFLNVPKLDESGLSDLKKFVIELDKFGKTYSDKKLYLCYTKRN